jgi:thiamine pyridinylase
MRIVRIFRWWLFAVALLCIATATVLLWDATARITLRVALYPYIPDKQAVASAIAQGFKKRNPYVDLVFIDNDDLNNNYYKGGLLKIEADIYEIDTILLTDMLPKLSALELDPEAVPPEVLAAVTRDGRVFAMPHWMCGNFLFFKRGDQEVEKVASWEALLAILAERKSNLLVDLKGSSGLGEWYLTILADNFGVEAAQKEILESPKLSELAKKALKDIVQACPAGFCRSQKLHDEGSGVYAKLFVRGRYAAYIGYSESIYWGLRDARTKCGPADECLTEDNIAVRRMPSFAGGVQSGGVGWVDALAIGKDVTGRKRKAALEFISYVTSPEVYAEVLSASDVRLLRYVLPARTDAAVWTEGLYPQFLTAHVGRVTGTRAGLNDALRKKGGMLDTELPSRD